MIKPFSTPSPLKAHCNAVAYIQRRLVLRGFWVVNCQPAAMRLTENCVHYQCFRMYVMKLDVRFVTKNQYQYVILNLAPFMHLLYAYATMN